MTDSSRLAELNSASNSLAASTDFASTLGGTLYHAATLVNAGCSLLILFNRTTKDWALHSHHGLEPEDVGDRYQLGIRAAQTGEVAANERAIALPLKARGQVAGALQVERSGGFTADDRLILEAFAAVAALAIDSTLSKTDFVSTVTHELRLPMTSIKGYTDLIRGGMAGPVNDMQKQLLETVHNNVNWMNALVSDLSDIAKVETGRLKVSMEWVNPAACIEEAVSALRPQFEAKTQTLAVNVPALPQVRADGRRVVQILTYLLTNANRYTAANGQVTLSAETQDSFVRFTVADNGVGMTPVDKARLFSQFFRSEDPVVRDHKGWGLALHLVKRLIELFGGQIGADSEYGKGSTFWFTIPVASNQ